MTEKEFDIILEQTIKENAAEYIDYSENFDEPHEFSCSFEKKMNRLIKQERSSYYPLIKTPLRRLTTMLVTMIVSISTLALTIFAVESVIESFNVDTHEKYTNVIAVDDPTAPTKILYKYELDYDLSGYTETVYSDDTIQYGVSYQKDTHIIYMVQTPKSLYYNVRFNTENSPTGLQQIYINGHEALYFETYDHSHCVAINMDDYIIDIGTNISKDELMKLAESIKIAEK